MEIYDPIATIYSKVFTDIRQRIFEWPWLEKQLSILKPEQVLDLGCGNGYLCNALLQYSGKVYGIDPCRGMIQHARESLDESVKLQIASAENLPFDSKKFDLVISFLSFRYMDQEKTAREVFRVLRPGGRFIIIDFFKSDFSRWNIPLLIKTKLLTIIQKGNTPVYKETLNHLSRDPQWRKLVQNNPRKRLNQNMRDCDYVFGRKFQKTLSLGFKGKTSALIYQKPLRRRVMVVDWGIGGLPIFNGLTEKLPGIDFLYVSDAGFTPYGKATEEALGTRVLALENLAEKHGIWDIVIACNALSSVNKEAVTITEKGIRIYSIIHSFLESFKEIPSSLAIIAGNRTINSGAYKDPFESRGISVIQNNAQELSKLIEAGDYSKIDSALKRILTPLRRADSLLLGCTHYPAVSKQILEMFPHFSLIDPSYSIINRVSLDINNPSGRGRKLYFTTGNTSESSRGASRAFGIEGIKFRHIPLNLSKVRIREFL